MRRTGAFTPSVDLFSEQAHRSAVGLFLSQPAEPTPEPSVNRLSSKTADRTTLSSERLASHV